MEVSCSSDFIVFIVGFKKGADGEELSRDSVNSSVVLFTVPPSDRVGNFMLVGKYSTVSVRLTNRDY